MRVARGKPWPPMLAEHGPMIEHRRRAVPAGRADGSILVDDVGAPISPSWAGARGQPGPRSAMACSPDPTPRGYHSPSVAWSHDELGVVWLDRRAPYEAVMLGRAREDAQPKAKGGRARARCMALRSAAHRQRRPRPARGVDAGRRSQALPVRARRRPATARRARVRTIVESSVSLCPRLVWTGDAYVVGWREGDGLYLGTRGQPHAARARAPAHQRRVVDRELSRGVRRRRGSACCGRSRMLSPNLRLSRY